MIPSPSSPHHGLVHIHSFMIFIIFHHHHHITIPSQSSVITQRSYYHHPTSRFPSAHHDQYIIKIPYITITIITIMILSSLLDVHIDILSTSSQHHDHIIFLVINNMHQPIFTFHMFLCFTSRYIRMIRWWFCLDAYISVWSYWWSFF